MRLAGRPSLLLGRHLRLNARCLDADSCERCWNAAGCCILLVPCLDRVHHRRRCLLLLRDLVPNCVLAALLLLADDDDMALEVALAMSSHSRLEPLKAVLSAVEAAVGGMAAS